MEIPRVWILADRRGWAFDETGIGLRAALAGQVDIQIAYSIERTDLASWPYDLIYQLWWKGTYHRDFTIKSRDTLLQVSSHRWLEPAYGELTPKKLARKYLQHAAIVTVPSRRLAELLHPVADVRVCPKGFDPDRYFDRGARTGAIVAGWAGNPNDLQKGLLDVVIPGAHAAEVELKLAAGDVGQDAMPDFYAGIDVICIGSAAEGDPRPLIEGMASGCFPIATDVGIVPELVRHGDNGFIVGRSPEAFRHALRWCARNPDRVRDAGRRNAVQLRAIRTWDAVAPAWRDAMREAHQRKLTFDQRHPRRRHARR